MNEAAQRAGLRQSLKVGAGLAQAPADALDGADVEPSSDEGVEVDAARDDVSSRFGGGQAPGREYELVERLCLDEREVKAYRVPV